MKPKLELFKFDACPFCQIVYRTIQKLNLKVEMLDIFENEVYLNRLLEKTGKRTVPCLFIDGRPMFESADIMAWLEQNQADLEKN
jgi:glutaredoxin